MLALISLNPLAIVSTFAEDIGRLDLPSDPPAQVSPAIDGWSNADLGFRIAAVTPAAIPPGKRAAGAPSYTLVAGLPVETVTLEDIPVERRLVAKSLVQQRLIDGGKINAAFAALNATPAYFARWFAPDRPAVYADDPDALALLAAIGADPAVIMAAE